MEINGNAIIRLIPSWPFLTWSCKAPIISKHFVSNPHPKLPAMTPQFVFAIGPLGSVNGAAIDIIGRSCLGACTKFAKGIFPDGCLHLTTHFAQNKGGDSALSGGYSDDGTSRPTEAPKYNIKKKAYPK